MRRFFDIIFSVMGMVLLSPFFLICVLLILFDSGLPIFYGQKRIGRSFVEFRLLKFRTMYVDSDKRGLITVGGRDPRITKSGVVLRKSKLDELPQLINVLAGDMSIVGPRPEVKKYVDQFTEDYRYLLKVRPGITSPASLAYSNENEILSDQDNPERYYVSVVLPDKIRLDKECVTNHGLKDYFALIFYTLGKVIKGNK